MGQLLQIQHLPLGIRHLLAVVSEKFRLSNSYHCLYIVSEDIPFFVGRSDNLLVFFSSKDFRIHYCQQLFRAECIERPIRVGLLPFFSTFCSIYSILREHFEMILNLSADSETEFLRRNTTQKKQFLHILYCIFEWLNIIIKVFM